MKVQPNRDNRGNIQPGRQYVYQDPKHPNDATKTITIRDDADGHKYLDDPMQNRGSHFNNPNGDHYDY